MLPDITWNDAREEHIAAHNVQPQEVEQAFYSRPRWLQPSRGGTTIVFGQTYAGRYLSIVTVPADDGGTLIVTARTMTATERKAFLKKGR